jgi:hypothetical protein
MEVRLDAPGGYHSYAPCSHVTSAISAFRDKEVHLGWTVVKVGGFTMQHWFLATDIGMRSSAVGFGAL